MTLSARPLMYKHVKCIYVHSFQKLLICISVAPQEGGNLPKNIGATSKKVVVLGGAHHKAILSPSGGGGRNFIHLWEWKKTPWSYRSPQCPGGGAGASSRASASWPGYAAAAAASSGLGQGVTRSLPDQLCLNSSLRDGLNSQGRWYSFGMFPN